MIVHIIMYCHTNFDVKTSGKISLLGCVSSALGHLGESTGRPMHRPFAVLHCDRCLLPKVRPSSHLSGGNDDWTGRLSRVPGTSSSQFILVQIDAYTPAVEKFRNFGRW